MRINYLAVIAASALHWILGGVWYAVFTKPFTGFIGEEKMKELETHSEATAFILALLSSLVLMYLLAHLLRYTNALTLPEGLKVIFLVWLGSIAATQLLSVLFEGRHFGLYLLNIGYQLVACCLAGTILISWKAHP